MKIEYRARRLRVKENLRRMVAETRLSVNEFIMPCFVMEGSNVKEPVKSMPEVFRFSVDNLIKEIEKIRKNGIVAILIFGIPHKKDETGSYAYSRNGIVQKAVKKIKKEFPDMLVITDVCMCSYTSHGHCGILKEHEIDNDKTLKVLSKIALSHASSGADIVAPSSMMDGQVMAIRETLDKNDFSYTAIMSYSSKFASNFYGPFREAAASSPKFGNRKSYQLDYRNVSSAVKEAEADVKEGADIIMVKPALSYLDVIKTIKDSPLILGIPLAAYNVSGEYSMVKAAALRGWLDEKDAVLEILTSIKRAGANLIITYWAKEIAEWLKEYEK